MLEYAQTMDWSWLREIVIALYGLTVISIIIIVISENRNPVKTLAWVTVLVLLPMLGIVLYMFFGRNIKNSHKMSRRMRRQMRRKEAPPQIDEHFLEALQPESLHLIRLGQTLTGGHLYQGNTVEVFTSGREKFDSLIRDLENARHFIHLEYYIFENDKIGSQIAEILIRRALEGLNVRVIYDHVGSFSVKSKFFKRMRRAGIQVFPFFEVTFPQLGTRINWRNHRKICVIDGRIGYLGGMNIADRYITGGKKFDSWRDTHVRVTGPILAALQHSFAIDWHFMNQPLPTDSAKSTTQRTGSIAAQLITSGPTSQWSNIAYMFNKAIGNARKRIYIQTPYFLPTDSLLKGLISAALAKVDVRILIPARTDSPLLNFASASYIAECLQAGIKIYFYDAGMLHSKLIIVDDEIVTIGSTNFDFRSFEHNFEGNLFFYSKELNQQLTEIYHNDLTHAHRITPQAWRKRPFWRRAMASIVRLLSPIL